MRSPRTGTVTMLHILFSRAALFPWLGLLLMAAGAAFPDGNVVGIVFVVLGANVAFYSLRDFGLHFEWGTRSRPLLALSGLSFFAGLGLLLVATRFDNQTRLVATSAAGLYLCLFPAWTIQMPVGWGYRILAIAGTLLMLLGGIFAHISWQDWRVFAETEPEPQVLTLSDLLQNGHGKNRYVRLTGFRFCDQSVPEKHKGKVSFDVLWFPVVPLDDGVKKDGPPPPVPARIRAVAGYVSIGGEGPGRVPIGRNIADSLRRKKEAEGYEVTVVTGLRKLNPEVRDQLVALAPDTDLSEVVVLDWRTPRSADRAYSSLLGGGAAFLLGFLALLVVYVRAWKAVGEPVGNSVSDHEGEATQPEV